MASAAARTELDNEFLTSRGIRVTETRFMHLAFSGYPRRVKLSRSQSQNGEWSPRSRNVRFPRTSIKISVYGDDEVAFDCELSADETASYPKWKQRAPISVKRD